MSKLKKRIDPDPDPDPQELDPATVTAEDIRQAAIEEQESAAALAIEEVMGREEIQEGICLVRRRGINDPEWMHLETVPVSSMRPDVWDFIAKRYGGGRYELIFKLPSRQFFSKKRLDIDFRVAEGEFFKAQREPAATAPSAIDKLVDTVSGRGEGNQTLLLTFLKMMQDQNAAMMKVQTEASAQVITAISNMAAALKGGEKPAFNMLEALAVFDKLKSKDSNVDAIKILDLAHNWFSENSTDDEPQWVKFVQALVPVLLGQMPGQVPQARQIEAQPQPGPVSGPVTQPNGQPQPQPTIAPPVVAMPAATTDPPEEMNISLLLRMIRPKLFAQIEAGASPQDAVDLVENPLFLTDAIYTEIETALKAETWKGDLFGDMNLTEKQDVWLTEFRRLFLEPERGETQR